VRGCDKVQLRRRAYERFAAGLCARVRIESADDFNSAPFIFPPGDGILAMRTALISIFMQR